MSILWIDLETTGLNYDCFVLEVAVVITDDEFEPLFQDSWVVRDFMSPVAEVRGDADPIVQEMHDATGLWNEVEVSPLDLGMIEGEIIEALDVLGITEAIRIGGSGVSAFDRHVIRLQMPRLEERLHYQSYDVSPLRLFMRQFGVPDLRGEAVAHRALPDTQHAIAQWRYYTNRVTEWKAASDWKHATNEDA